MQPTKQQQLILDYQGCSVVIAAPGSGKTFVISNMIKKVLPLLMGHQGVIAISYTNKASNELKHRSLSNGEDPCSSFFGTIDKFTIAELIIPFGRHIFGHPSVPFQVRKIAELTEEDRAQLNQFIVEKEINLLITKLGNLYLEGIVLIELVGLLANHIFSKSKACKAYIKARYTHIYIDEYQDSGKEQHELFLSIKGLGIIATAVGDLNQSIYEFSKKDARYLKELTENAEFKYFKLDKNHRCAPGIINYSNYLLNPKTELIADEDRPIIFQEIKGNNKEVAEWIDNYIDKFKRFYNIKDNNRIAILTRYTRTAYDIDKSLTTAHHYSESTELDKNLNVWSSIFSSLLNFLFDVNYLFIDVVNLVTDYSLFSKKEMSQLNNLKKSIKAYRGKPIKEMGALKDIFCGVAKIIAPNSENLDSVHLLSEVLNSEALLKNYLPIDDTKISILTLHKSKGLEFDMIFHLDLHEWVLPSKHPGPNNDFDNLKFDNYQQDLNLHYVGITRARKVCILLSSTLRINHKLKVVTGKPSEFLSLNDIGKLRYIKNRSK